MRLAIIDSRKNQIIATPKLGSDSLRAESYQQYAIDLDAIPKNHFLTPAWITSFEGDGSWMVFPGVCEVKGPQLTIQSVEESMRPWVEAGLWIARKQFGKALTKDRVEAGARIAYWLSGGREFNDKGTIKDVMERDDLPLMILTQWPRWQTEQFSVIVKEGKLKLWSARLETIKEAGYTLALDENRLEVTCQRMGFKGELRKSQKR